MKIESVSVVIPSHTGSIRHEIAQMLWRWAADRGAPATLAEVGFYSGSSMIGATRDYLATRFLGEGRGSHLLFIDDDMAPQYEHAVRILHTAKTHQPDVVSGCCYKKRVSPTPANRPLAGGSRRGPLVEMLGVGMAFTLIARDALDSLSKTCGRYSPPSDPGFPQGDRIAFFHTPNPACSEDFAFCHRAIKAGFKVWMDEGCIVPHVGPVHFPIMPSGDDFFTPDLSAFLREAEEQKKRASAAVSAAIAAVGGRGLRLAPMPGSG